MKVLIAVSVVFLGLAGCQSRPSPNGSAPPPQAGTQQGAEAESGQPAEEAAAPQEAPQPLTAQVDLQGLGEHTVSGQFTLVEEQGVVRLRGTIQGLEPNSTHAFHIHEKGDCSSPDGSSAGPHFDPHGAPHGAPGAGTHVGDLGNITADDSGNVQVEQEVPEATLGAGETSVINRAIIVHEGVDDLTSQPSGNAGGRIACGVIQKVE